MSAEPVFIILEGPDACGKTTFANTFVESHGAKYMHLTYIKDDREMFRANYMALVRARLWLEQGKSVVLDRSWISENVYSHVWRGGSKMAYDVAGFDRVIRRLCGIYVMCCPPAMMAAAYHRKEHAKREEMYEPGPKIFETAAHFERVTWGTAGKRVSDDYVGVITSRGGMSRRPDFVFYDRGTSKVDEVREQVVIRSRALRQTQFNAPTLNFLGHPLTATHLFVGDRVNANKARRAWPFVDFGASSRTLAEAIGRSWINDWASLFINAWDDDMLDEFWEWPHRRDLIVVALGKNASKKCQTLNIPHETVYHPSFARRFGQTQQFNNQINRLPAA